MVYFKKNYNFKVPKGVQHFQGVSNFCQSSKHRRPRLSINFKMCFGCSKFSFETYRTCDFPGVSGPNVGHL